MTAEDAREERDEREAGYRLEDAADRSNAALSTRTYPFDDVVTALLTTRGSIFALETMRWGAEEIHRLRQALEDAAREVEFWKHRWSDSHDDAVKAAVQVAQAREELDSDHEMPARVVLARRILSDPDSSARLRAVQADARREVADDIRYHCTIPSALASPQSDAIVFAVADWVAARTDGAERG